MRTLIYLDLDQNEQQDELFHIGETRKHKIYVEAWLREPAQASERAYKVCWTSPLPCSFPLISSQDFLPSLKTHLLARHRGEVIISDEPTYTEDQLRGVYLKNGLIYTHSLSSFDYTTYDVRRETDRVNIKNDHRDVMMHANDGTSEDGSRRHPFWYARVLGIFHADIYFDQATKPKRVDFLFVRWFGSDPEWEGGPAGRRLDRIGFVPENDPSGAFGFLNPARVIRACHLIPAFSLGKTTTLLGRSKFRDAEGLDWVNYYVSRCVSFIG
jgi:hypothetical protein